MYNRPSICIYHIVFRKIKYCSLLGNLLYDLLNSNLLPLPSFRNLNLQFFSFPLVLPNSCIPISHTICLLLPFITFIMTQSYFVNLSTVGFFLLHCVLGKLLFGFGGRVRVSACWPGVCDLNFLLAIRAVGERRVWALETVSSQHQKME